MAKYIDDGNYDAVGTQASVYRNEKQNVVLLTEWFIPELNKSIKAWDCLFYSNGDLNERTYMNVRKWAKEWDGRTLKWFAANIAHCEVSLKIENELTGETLPDGTPRTRTNVKYINPRGGAASELPADDSDALDKLFAAKLRANAGAATTKPVTAAAKPVETAPKAATKPADAPAPAGATTYPPSDKKSVWARFGARCAENGVDGDAKNDKWLELVAAAGLTTEYDTYTPNDWGKVLATVEADDFMPF